MNGDSARNCRTELTVQIVSANSLAEPVFIWWLYVDHIVASSSAASGNIGVGVCVLIISLACMFRPRYPETHRRGKEAT